MSHRSLIRPAIAAAALVGCAPRFARETRPDATFVCGDAQTVQRTAGHVTSANRAQLVLGWIDAEGDHYVTMPSLAMEAIEYVVPADPRADAIERVYDTSQGMARSDWRLARAATCIARGGYRDALARYARGASFAEITAELSLADEHEARLLVDHALASLQRRYAASAACGGKACGQAWPR